MDRWGVCICIHFFHGYVYCYYIDMTPRWPSGKVPASSMTDLGLNPDFLEELFSG